MTLLVETSGAQILPPIDDDRATTSAYLAWSCCSADLRTKSPAHAAIAATLRVTTTAHERTRA